MKGLVGKSEVVDVIDFSLHEICVRQEYGNYIDEYALTLCFDAVLEL